MPDVGTPSLDQLRVFLAVVEAGSFAAAGRRLNRATSAISYTIGHLEKQLGIASVRSRANAKARSDGCWQPRCCQKRVPSPEGSTICGRR